VCAVASGRGVGVDIERVIDRSIEPGIADLICAETEKQSLAVLQGMRWQQQFFALWTLKEAYAKARGAGLALPLHECAFEVQAGFATVVMAKAPGDAPSRWQFWQQGIFRDYVMAVCAERTDVPVQTVSPRTAIPLSGDSSLEWDSLRSLRLSEAGVSEVEWD
jgi:4'-phosphopantetheinyl transferase